MSLKTKSISAKVMNEKLVHIELSSPYDPKMGYQENILARKHKQMGYDVTVISHNPLFPSDYSDGDIPVINLPLHKGKSILYRVPFFCGLLDRFSGFAEAIDQISPDIIFVHSTIVSDCLYLKKYKHNHPDVRIFADSHLDYYNSPIKDYKTWITYHIFSRHLSRKLASVCEKVWGVTPWRVEFLEEVLGVPKNKVDLLVMGGDEDYIDFEHRDIIRSEIRRKYEIPQDAFLVVTGGRIDRTKNIHLLIEAIKNINLDLNVYLLVFGKYQEDMKAWENESDYRIKNAGWIPSEKSYEMFLASDLGCFPGTHSVLWEQACACGLPCLFKNWGSGFSHIDIGGNCLFLGDISAVSLTDTISKLMRSKRFMDMDRVAKDKARERFLYINIAKKAIDIDYESVK